jgi:hypothetical protein
MRARTDRSNRSADPRVKGVAMGQATVLPDPLDEAASSTATTAIASADDLLSQLAGEEIDRLLAESEAERAAVAEPAPAAALAPVPPVEAHPANGPADDVIAATLAAAPAPAPEPIPGPVAAPLEAAAPAPQVLAPPAPPVAAPEPEPEVTAGAERIALADEIIVESPLEEPSALPLYLKPLEWLNAPLQACPETLREVIGKVAIVTLVNAVAVLAYVLLFRKH